MKKYGPVPDGHVVKDYYIGHTHIKICDDCYRDKTPEELEAQRQRLSDLCYELLEKQARREALEKASANY
jgi:hypothetical protein|nr:MAG TPA: hypothetical protein [Caudoviricetes sp.]DAU53234.1 MAG TPA: hypothetical protein [Caudoviricetes sp.]